MDAERLISLREVIQGADALLQRGERAAARVWPTGFVPLDTYLAGGLRSGELALLGGSQGLGKTTFALQLLRNVVTAGAPGIYFSFEHDTSTVLEKFLAIEASDAAGAEAVPLRRIREALEVTDGAIGGLAQRLAGATGGAAAVHAVSSYADRLFIHRATGSDTSVETIRQVVAEVAEKHGETPLIVVDYLQKVLVPGGSAVEEERVTTIAEGLKDLALAADAPVFAVVAADKDGLAPGRRLRVHHLRGSSALAYEADIVLIMNDKYDAVARHHLVYNVGNAERFRNYVVVSIEKNRAGLDHIDLEFRKRFEQGRFEVDGAPVPEQLVDERLYVE